LVNELNNRKSTCQIVSESDPFVANPCLDSDAGRRSVIVDGNNEFKVLFWEKAFKYLYPGYRLCREPRYCSDKEQQPH